MQTFFKISFLSILFLTITSSASAQEYKIPSYFRNFINVDSILFNTREVVIFFPEVIVLPQKVFKNERERRRYNRLVRNFKVVYPYALQIGETYRNIEDSIIRISNPELRKRYIKLREKQIMDYYKPQLTQLTLSQGVLLVKLLDRQTGSTAFEIIEELKGSVKAFFWQGFALLFGNNLKREYDSKGEDKDIEYLVIRYENGSL